MPSIRSRLIRTLLVERKMKILFNPHKTSLEQVRKMKAPPFPLPRRTSIQRLQIDHLNGYLVKGAAVPTERKNIIMHVLGGGFVRATESHLDMAARISNASELPVLLFDYRLAPEYKYPAAIMPEGQRAIEHIGAFIKRNSDKPYSLEGPLKS